MLRKILRRNWLAILYFNFRMLPFKQAILLPFDFVYKIRFESLAGNVILASPKIYRAMIKFGGRGSEMFSRQSTVIDLKGTVVFDGLVEIGHGCLLRVEKNAIIKFGSRVRLGAFTKVFCANHISFGNEIDFSWESQIFDTNFHSLKNVNTSVVDKLTEPVYIGSYNWFGNRVTVSKGTRTPNYFVCASNSLCNKDYTFLPKFSIVAGTPAKLVASDKIRIFENI